MRAGARQGAPGSGSAALTAARAEVVRAGTASGAGRLPAVLSAAAPGVLAAAAASVAVFGDGGFAPSARVAFAAVAAVALVAAFACEPLEAARLIRSPVVVVLLALAALAAVSAVWTVASPGASFRWAAVTAGYAGVTVAAAVAARRHGPAPLAVLVCVLAAATVAGGFVPRGHSSPETARGLSLAAICSLAPVCWLAIRSALARLAPSAGSRTVSPLRAATLASALAAAALAVGTAVFTEPSGSAAETSGGFAHGRAHTWRAALAPWGDRPIAGAGADAFLMARARRRHDGGRFVPVLPLALAAGLGVA